MTAPSSREQFKQYCLRRCGFPVLEMEVDDDQLEDRIDDALQYYTDYHFDATEPVYYKHQIAANNYPDRINSITVDNGGNNYSNDDIVVFSNQGNGYGANASILTDSSGVIQSVTLSDNGQKYSIAPTISVTSANGSGAELTATLGGFVTVPENIIGAIRIFDIASLYSNINNMFSVQYQILLNEIWSISGVSMVPYYTSMMHLQLIHELLVGQQPIRFQRHKNQVYVDMNWERFKVGDYLILEAYQVIDPVKYTDVWNDRWLKRYCTALFKQQVGTHLKKFTGQLPGGIQFNGQQTYDEATNEIAKLEDEMINSFSIPHQIFIG